MEPHGTEQERWWNFLNDGDVFWRISKWPPWMQEHMMRRGHLNTRERYRAMLFFCHNGLNPNIAYEWVTHKDVDPAGHLIRRTDYDDNAIRELRRHVERAKTGDLFNANSYIWDMTLNDKVRVRPERFEAQQPRYIDREKLWELTPEEQAVINRFLANKGLTKDKFPE